MSPVDALGKIPVVKNLPKPAKWAVGIAGIGALGYVVYRYATKGDSGGDPETPTEGATEDFAGYPGDAASPITSTPVGQPVDPGGFTQPTTDAGWVRDAVDKMYTVGYTDTAMVARVLSVWLQGSELADDGEITVVRTAVGLAGRPPSGDHPFRVKQASPAVPTPSQPTPSVPTPVTATPKPVAAQGTWTVHKGENLSSIAAKLRKTYNNGVTWQTIYAMNRGVIGSNPNKIKPNQVLTVPH